jgi:glycosyltransferase involved in cell wall biosynthesis
MNRQPRVIKNFARQIQKQLKNIKPDIILSFSGPALGMLDTDKPMVLWPDAVFEDLIDFYPQFTNMAGVTIRNGNQMEQKALERCSHIVYSSNWAANGAMKHYNIPSDKISVIPYGANIDSTDNEDSIEEKIRLKSNKICKLLFVGVDWYRKGGDLALRTAKYLHNQGLNTELHILGTHPPATEEIPPFVKVHGFVSKETEEGKIILQNLISKAHFLILPTLADCSPIVFAEFNAYGIPCLTSDVGGIATIIRDEVNGKKFSTQASPQQYADYILYHFTNYTSYQQLAKNSYQEYRDRLNWEVSGKKMMEVLRKIINNHSQRQVICNEYLS